VFEEVTATPGYQDGEPTITVTAVVRNTSRRARATPGVRISLLDAKGDELFAWSVTLAVAEIGPRQAARFTARLARPPLDTEDVELQFLRDPPAEAVSVATELVGG
jgi:hypothetical protein